MGPVAGRGGVKQDGRTVAKSDLPSKICPVCHRPFTWRRKWERDWDNVVYCSERCRKGQGPIN